MIVFSKHALEQMRERGASEEDVRRAIGEGEQFPAKHGRMGYRLNLPFNAQWGDKQYASKQVAPIVAIESSDQIVVTVYVFYF